MCNISAGPNPTAALATSLHWLISAQLSDTPQASCRPQAGQFASLSDSFSPAKQERLEHSSASWEYYESKYYEDTKSQVL